jgi:hypothetical protein
VHLSFSLNSKVSTSFFSLLSVRIPWYNSFPGSDILRIAAGSWSVMESSVQNLIFVDDSMLSK